MTVLPYKMQDNMSFRPDWEADEKVHPRSTERVNSCFDRLVADAGFRGLSKDRKKGPCSGKKRNKKGIHQDRTSGKGR